MEIKPEEKEHAAVQGSIPEESLTTGNNIETKAETKKLIIVDFTAFNSRGERIFFNKRMDEVHFELMQHCNTTVVHKTTEYEMSVLSKVETKVEKPLEIVSILEENTINLLKARRYILKVASSVINERITKKLIKRSDDLDDIIMNDNLH